MENYDDQFENFLNKPPVITRTFIPKNDSIIKLLDKNQYFVFLPLKIKSMIEELGYIVKYYSYPPGKITYLIELSLQHQFNGNLQAYSSTIKKKEATTGTLNYYALLHVVDKSKSDDNEEIAIIAVFNYLNSNSSVVVIAADDIMEYDSWISKIYEFLLSITAKKGVSNQ